MRNIFRHARTRPKKKKHLFKLKYLVFLIITYLAYDTTYTYLIQKNISLSDEKITKAILSETNHSFLYNYKPQAIVIKALTFLSNIDISKPASILNIKVDASDTKTESTTTSMEDDTYDADTLGKITEYVEDPNKTSISNPLIYLYNSHQLENYSNEGLELYNITPNVLIASYMLKEKLNDLGLPTIVEDSDITEFLKANNWDYNSSYKASRIYILAAKNKYDSLKYFIDIHRDSSDASVTTTMINGKNYARILFVVGLENTNYQANLSLAEKINTIANEKYPGISRGILKKEGKGVNGVYNQDISPNMMLIEVGGASNSIEDVLNTVEALSNVLFTFIEGK